MFRLHTKIVTLMMLAMGFMLLTTMIYHYSHTKEAEQFNIAYKDNLAKSIQNIIRLKEHDLMKTTLDYCVWDEMVQFVHTPDSRWSDINLNTILSTLGCSLIVVYDDHFGVVYKAKDSIDFKNGGFFLATEPLKEAFKGKTRCHFYIYTDDGLIEISGAPIVPSLDTGLTTKPQGYLITGRTWNKKFLADLENITNADIELFPIVGVKENSGITAPNKKETVKISQFLPDFRNHQIVRLDFTSRTQYQQNQDLFLYFTLIPLFITALLGILFYFVFRSWIAVPLKLLTDGLDNENPEPLRKISLRNKEFHSLGSMMIDFFEAKKKLEMAADERKIAEQRILKLSTALEQSSSIIIITDPQGNIDYASRRFFELTGYNRSEVIGQNPRILKSGHHPAEFYRNLWKTINSGIIWKGEFLNKKKDGSLFWESATITPIKDLEGKIINFLAVKEDISEQKEAQEKLHRYAQELKESNSSKDKFFSILAHDLKAPFHSMLGYSELLATEYDTLADTDRRKFILILRQSTKNVYDLVENLLQWSRLQTGRITCIPEVFDLFNEVEYCVDLFRAIALRKNITLSSAIPTGSHVFADKNMVRSILQNLISNALKFTSTNGFVKIDTVLRSGSLEIRIIDSGIGMNEEELAKIFRIDSSYTKKGTAMESGTGLGLIICKELVMKNNGTIFAESKLGQGSTFSFTLPTDPA